MARSIPRKKAAVALFFLSCFVFNLNFRKLRSFGTVAASLLPFNIWEGHGPTLASPGGSQSPPVCRRTRALASDSGEVSRLVALVFLLLDRVTQRRSTPLVVEVRVRGEAP